MMEILSEAIRPVNLPFTVLLGFVVLYWLLMGIGLISFDSSAEADLQADVDVHADADAHLDAHADADVHADVHADAHADVDSDAHVDGDAHAEAGGHAEGDGHHGGHGGAGWLSPVLQFLNVGDVPVMVVLSTMAVFAWAFSMVLNYYWNDGTALRLGLFLAGNLVLTCVVTHFATRPLKALFKALNREYDEHLPIVGRTCTITTSAVTADFGQAEIITKGAPILINVRTTGDAVLNKGETGLVIKEDKSKSIYTIVKVTTDKLEA